MSDKIYEMITTRIIELLEKGDIPWKRPWRSGFPMNLISKKPYRGINTFILGATGFSSPYWLTFKQASEKRGQIKKGSTGFPIVFWNWMNKKSKDEGEDAEKIKKVPFLRYYTVFNLDQCEGILPPEECEDREITKLEAPEFIVENMPQRPTIHHGESRAYYRPSTDSINMPRQETFIGDEEYYSTLFHELIHSTGHKNRLNRHEKITNHMFGSQDYSKEELVAEMGSAFLCGVSDIEPSVIENQTAYINGWLKKLQSDKKLLIQAAAQAQKAADFILNNNYEEVENG
jgi:antirestriction protein ArdC